jgi:ParB-like chromosome segregation protein Spo0J
MSRAETKRVVWWDIERLIPYDKNAKKHGPEQVAKIAASMRAFGGFNPGNAIIVDKDGVIIAGHGRRLAAMLNEYTKVPVVVRDDLTPEQVRAYRLADNKVAESTYDTEMMAEELSSLVNDFNFSMDDFFDARDLNFAVDDLGEIDLGALTEDLASQVEQHSQSTQTHIDTEDDRTVSLAKIFGFSQVTTSQSRVLARLLALAEGETNEKGAAALCSYATEFMGV